VACASYTATRNYKKNWAGATYVRAGPDAAFAACCLSTKRFDGILRDDHFRS
jgi:hypothetical protein